MNKKQKSHQHGGRSQVPTCDNCVHTFKHNRDEDTVVCVPHLKTMPASHSRVCDLHSFKILRV